VTTVLDGETLSTSALEALGDGQQIALDAEAKRRVDASREIVDRIISTQEVVYGINTGFGLFSNVTISPDKLCELQDNLIRSHAAGCGEPLSRERSRRLLALRINVLAKGHSGIRSEVLEQMIAAFNADCIPIVPCKGTVGASGDLAPLSHIALGLMGEGDMWDPSGGIAPASEVLSNAGLTPIRLGAKEGLAMINGTQLMASLGAEAVERASRVTRLADYIAALTLETLCGTSRAFDPLIHCVRPHSGQMQAAARVRSVLMPQSPSQLSLSHRYAGKVQDAYSLRCVPQVHGVVHDTIQFVKGILDTELNSATDNPMVFTQQQVDESEAKAPSVEVRTSITLPYPIDVADASVAQRSPAPQMKRASVDSPRSPTSKDAALDEANRKIAALERQLELERSEKLKEAPNHGPSWSFFKKDTDTRRSIAGGGLIISGGNFHGEYPAKAMDFLTISMCEIANISERRIERLCNPSLSGLPAFLVAEGGFNSGFMIAHCTAAALASENKVLSHPSSVDTISTSAAKEDHVSMGGMSARKALEVVENVETVLAIELLAACQGLEFHRPLATSPPLEALHALVREHVAPWDRDRQMAPDIRTALKLVQSGEALRVVEDCLSKQAS